ncbi:MAG: hypothetical protein EOP45_14025, partial [Sphingobacteriaceae bacterium]
MNLYKQTENFNLIGVEVKTFPKGIKEAFDGLVRTLGSERAYYGVSWMDESDTVKYYALAREIFTDEGMQHNYELLTIEKGIYQTETVNDWISKTDCIKDVFHTLMATNKPDKNYPCIEWYKSNMEMLC